MSARRLPVVAPLAFSLLASGGTAHAEDPPTPSGVLQSLAADSGVAVQTVCTNCNNADLSLGGLGNAHVPVVCDDVVVPAGLPQIYLLTILPPGLIEKVAVERGASRASLEGCAVGGGITMSRLQPSRGFRLNVAGDAGGWGWSGVRADLSGAWRLLGGSFVATAARSEVIDSNEDGNPELPAFRRDTWEGRLTLRPSSSQTIRLGGLSYHENQEGGPAAWNSTTSRYNLEDVEIGLEGYDLVYEANLPDRSRFTVAGSWMEREEDIEETGFPRPDLDQPFPTYFIRETRRWATASWSRPMGSRVQLRAGFSWSGMRAEVVDVAWNAFALVRAGLITFDEIFTHALHEQATERGFWVEGEANIGSKVDLSVGARYADVTYRDDEPRPAWQALGLPGGNRLLPRAAVTFKPRPSVSVRVSAGAGFRAPEPSYQEVCCGRRYRNNRGMLMESSKAAGLEVTYQPDPKLRLTGWALRTDFDQYVLRLVSLTYEYRPTYQNANVPEARLSSFGFEGRFEPASWITARAAMSWVDPANRTPGGAIPLIVDTGSPQPYTITSQRIPYLPSRTGAVALDFRLPPAGTTFNLTIQHTGSRLIQWFDADRRDAYASETQPTLVGTPQVWTVNLRLDTPLRRGVGLFVGVDNATDYVQTDLGNPQVGYTWGPLRGRYVYGGVTYRFDK
jgi:outer membrane receptor protein involved in Fe transport